MSLVARFLTGDYTVIRSDRGTYVKGRWIPGPKRKIKICGSLQPTSARELKLPEEANRLKQYYKFYTDEPILLGSTATFADGDYIEVNGESFRAVSLTSWQNTDLDYFVTVIWREPQQSTDGKGCP